jgi:AcrR family transcriptional regulator
MRTRLSPEQRRAQLLEIGTELFARRPYEEVSVDDVADIAKISNRLLYHYFPSKRAFFLAIVEEQGNKLLQTTTPDPSLPPLRQVEAGLEFYIDSAEQSPDAYRMAHEAALADRDAQLLRQTRVAAQRNRILAALSPIITVDEEAEIMVTAWCAFAQTAILEWLDNPTITREQLRDLCSRALWAVLGLLPANQFSDRPVPVDLPQDEQHDDGH